MYQSLVVMLQVELAVKLGLPLLAPHPSIAHHFSLKTGAKQLFRAAKVHVPPGAELQPRPLASSHHLGWYNPCTSCCVSVCLAWHSFVHNFIGVQDFVHVVRLV